MVGNTKNFCIRGEAQDTLSRPRVAWREWFCYDTLPAILPLGSKVAFPVEELQMCDDALARVVMDSQGTTSSTTNSGNDSRPINAHHIERRKQKKKVIVKKLEKKLELYHRQIKRSMEG